MKMLSDFKLTFLLIPALLFSRIPENRSQEIDGTALVNPGELIFNEVMYKPVTGLGEWVEIYNRSDIPLDLSACYFSDSHVLEMQAIGSLILSPGGYLILAEETSVFSDYLIPFEAVLVVPDDFPALNNNGDTLYIFNASGEIVDMLPYPDDWGDVDNGVSMERVNPNNLSSVWLPCVNESGSTPGTQNSVFFTSDISSAVSLTAEPKVFFPEEPGMENNTTIIVDLQNPSSRINIRIFDVKGRLIRFLVKGEMSGPHSEYVWEGKNESGGYADIGMYIVHLKAISEPFKISSEAKYVVILGRKI